MRSRAPGRDASLATDLELLAAIASTPIDAIGHRFGPEQLAEAEGRAVIVLARLRGQSEVLARSARRSRLDRLVEGAGWLSGFASCAFTLWSVHLQGAGYLAAASMLASAIGFAVAAHQRDRVLAAERERAEALEAVRDQLADVTLAIRRLRLIRLAGYTVPGEASDDVRG